MLTEQVALYELCACSETPLLVTEHHAVAENDAICDNAGELYRAARAHRAFIIGDWIVTIIRACGAIARRAWNAYRQRRQARAIFEVLHRMDDRALRDIGFHRTELGPLAAGEGEHTRTRVVLWTLGL